jgi:hypothetical protein
VSYDFPRSIFVQPRVTVLQIRMLGEVRPASRRFPRLPPPIPLAVTFRQSTPAGVASLRRWSVRSRIAYIPAVIRARQHRCVSFNTTGATLLDGGKPSFHGQSDVRPFHQT